MYYYTLCALLLHLRLSLQHFHALYSEVFFFKSIIILFWQWFPCLLYMYCRPRGCMVRLSYENKQQLDMCLRDIGLCVQNLSTMRGSEVNIVKWSFDNNETSLWQWIRLSCELQNHEGNVYVPMIWVRWSSRASCVFLILREVGAPWKAKCVHVRATYHISS